MNRKILCIEGSDALLKWKKLRIKSFSEIDTVHLKDVSLTKKLLYKLSKYSKLRELMIERCEIIDNFPRMLSLKNLHSLERLSISNVDLMHIETYDCPHLDSVYIYRSKTKIHSILLDSQQKISVVFSDCGINKVITTPGTDLLASGNTELLCPLSPYLEVKIL